MSIRNAPVWAGIGAALVGFVLVLEGFHRTNTHPYHGLRFTLIGAMVFSAAAAHLAAVWWVGRVKMLHDVYRLGYRHGRHDSSMQLIEDGMLLDAQEARKRRENDETETS